MTPKRLMAVMFALVLVLAACGGDDSGDSDSDEDSNQSSQDGTGSDNGGNSDGDGNGASSGGDSSGVDGTGFPQGADEDFPIPVPEGWEIDVYAELAEEGVTLTGGVQVYYPQDEFDEIVAFYDEWYDNVPDPDQWARSETVGTVVYTRVSPLAQISISQDVEERGELRTFLTISAATE